MRYFQEEDKLQGRAMPYDKGQSQNEFCALN